MRAGIRAAVVLGTVAALAGAAAPAAGGTISTVRVRARDNFFVPKTITVERGTRVRWVNRGDNTHTTTSKAGLWDKPLPPGGSASRVFRKTGTFRYICSIHVDEGMRGRVVVV
jgi:plastocyanin